MVAACVLLVARGRATGADGPSAPAFAHRGCLAGTRRQGASADRGRPGVKSLRAAADAIRANRYDEAAAALDGTRLDGTPLEPYVEYYRALVDLRFGAPRRRVRDCPRCVAR